MLREEFRERLAEAGKKHDGHVTHGSLEEQMKVVLTILKEACPAFFRNDEVGQVIQDEIAKRVYKNTSNKEEQNDT
jgi:hypothetical protein